MPEQPTAMQLLARAAAIYDAPGSPLRPAVLAARRSGFQSGAQWMALAMGTIRRQAPAPVALIYQRLGITKYAMSFAAAGICALLAMALGKPWLGWIGVLAFYMVEAQMVFIFPLALDGTDHLFRESRRWTVRAGGTRPIMHIVLPLATTMIFGGFFGRGFQRSWCLGCLAVCIWYEDLRNVHAVTV